MSGNPLMGVRIAAVLQIKILSTAEMKSFSVSFGLNMNILRILIGPLLESTK